MSTRTQTFDDILGDQFDIRDVIARYEELESDLENQHANENDSITFDEWAEAHADDDDVAEFCAIRSFLDDVKGYGGDEQWRGDWYPVGFIADHYFERYAEELAEDIGAIQRNATWPNNCIDWSAAARALQQDYSSVTINGTEYWYR